MMLVKDIHHHECVCGCSIPSGEPAFIEADDCPICQFTIAPQQAQVSTVTINAPETFVLLRSFFFLSYSSIDAEDSSSRGPPMC